MQRGTPFFTPYRLASIGIVVLAMLVYLPCLQGMPVWDDKAITIGWGIGGGKSLLECFANPFLGHYYRPFTSASYYLDIALFGANPMLLHQTNILLHAAATAFLMALVQAVFARPGVTLLAGLAFAVQPAQVGTIAWIGGRCDQLGALFAVLFGWTLVRYHQTNRWPWMAVSLVAFFSAMMVKEQFATLGFAVPFAALAFRPQEEARRWAVRSTVPFFAVGVVFVGLWFAHFPDPYGAAAFGLGEQISRLGRTTLNYVLLLLFPNPVSMHTFSMENLRSPLLVALGLALFAGLFVGAYWLWRRDRRAAWLAIVVIVGFLPVSNLIPIPSLLAAPYRVGMIGPFVAALVALGISAAWQRRWFVPAGALALGALSGLYLTPWGAGKWTGESKLFGTFVAYDPSAVTLRGCYVNALVSEQRNDEALAQSSLVLNHLFGPGQWEDPRKVVSAIHNDLDGLRYRMMSGDGFARHLDAEVSATLAIRGHLLFEKSEDEAARRFLHAAVAVSDKNAKAWSELGQDAWGRRDPTAIGYLTKALDANPKDSVSASILAKCYLARGQRADAYRILETVPAMDPSLGEPLLDLAELQIQDGKLEEAKRTLDQAQTTIVDQARFENLRGKLGHRLASR